jgi:ABC-type antimicrobial peptide transport system permease subunit
LADLAEAGARVSAPQTRGEVFAVHRWFRGLLAFLGIAAMLVLGVGLWVSAGREARAARFEIGVRRAVGARRSELLCFSLGFVGVRLGFAVLLGAWLSLFLGAGLSEAYGAIPQVDWLALLTAGAWVSMTYLIGSFVPFVRSGWVAVMDCLKEAT